MAMTSLGNVDLKLLRVFMAVARSGGFALAQTELNISQSTISIHIGNLEKRLGMTLCQRGKGGFSLTEDGQRVHDATNALFIHIEDYRAVVSGPDTLVGEMQIAIQDNQLTHPTFRLENVLHELGRQDHRIELTIHTGPPNRLERMVLSGEAHMAIGYFPRKLAQFEYDVLYSGRMQLFCGDRHPLFDRNDDDIPLDAVIAAEHARRGYVSLDQVTELHRGLNYTARSDTADGLAYLALAGTHLVFLPEHFARRWVDAGRLRPVKRDDFGYVSEYQLIRRRNVARTPAEYRVFDLIMDEARSVDAA